MIRPGVRAVPGSQQATPSFIYCRGPLESWLGCTGNRPPQQLPDTSCFRLQWVTVYLLESRNDKEFIDAFTTLDRDSQWVGLLDYDARIAAIWVLLVLNAGFALFGYWIVRLQVRAHKSEQGSVCTRISYVALLKVLDAQIDGMSFVGASKPQSLTLPYSVRLQICSLLRLCQVSAGGHTCSSA